MLALRVSSMPSWADEDFGMPVFLFAFPSASAAAVWSEWRRGGGSPAQAAAQLILRSMEALLLAICRSALAHKPPGVLMWLSAHLAHE